MPIQAPQWTDFKLCPVCQNEFNAPQKPPVSLGCGHSVCRSCLLRLAKQQCPFDQAEIRNDITKLPVNYALLSLCGGPPIPAHFDVDIVEICNNRKQFDAARRAIEVLAESLQNVVITSSNNNYSNGVLTRPMQRKIVSIIHCQLGEPEGQARAMRAARSIGERAVKELILMHQSPQTLSTALWAAVRQRGCQFLGPAMQEAVLGFILLALEDGISLSRKVLVLFVVQRLEKQFTQASKTSIGHVVQLLYRASCFKVTKRDGDSSLLLLHEKYRTASALRKEHDAQIVQIAMEAGLHISPEQWSALLYGDDDHKSHMQSIIDKLQTPASFASSIQELIIALQRTDDPHDLQELQTHLEKLAAIDPSTEAPAPTWEEIEEAMNSLLVVVTGLKNFAKDYTSKNKGNIEGAQMINTKYRTSMCRDIMQRNTCPRGANCNFAHTEEELERYRKRRNLPVGRVNAPTPLSAFSQDGVSSRAGSTSSPDSCSDVADDFADLSINPSSPNRNLSISIPQQGVMPPHYRPVVTSAVYQTPSIGEPVVGSQFNHMKKEDVMSARDMMNQITPAVTHYNAVMRPSPLPQQPPPMQTAGGYMGQHQQQQSFYEMQRPAPAQQISPEQLYMQHQGGNTYNMYQQQQQPTQQPFYPSMQGHHQGGGYPAMGAHPNMFPPMGHFFSRTAVARGTANNMDDNTSSMREKNELSLSIPPLKESKDEWKNEMRSRGDSYIDSGRGSSLGYSSDATFSPRSSGSSGSRSSPPGNDKLWGESIWANVTDPSPVSSKSSPWSRWNLGSESRCDDERNSSTDSVTSKETISDERRYSMLKDWSGDILNNNRPSSHSLLGMYNQGQQQQQQGVRPPPGFKLLLEN